MGHSATFVFYYKTSVTSDRIIVETKTCIRPSATKVYKELMTMLSNRDVHCVGYDLAKNQK